MNVVDSSGWLEYFADKNGCCGIKERAKGHLWLTMQMVLREKGGIIGGIISGMF